jgi:hypothetical protein
MHLDRICDLLVLNQVEHRAHIQTVQFSKRSVPGAHQTTQRERVVGEIRLTNEILITLLDEKRQAPAAPGIKGNENTIIIELINST